MSKEEIIGKILENKERVKQFEVNKIGIFGSHAKGRARIQSDIDILVEFNKKSFDNYMDLKFFLENLLGAKVDLVISDAVKPRLKPIILGEVVYAKGF